MTDKEKQEFEENFIKSLDDKEIAIKVADSMNEYIKREVERRYIERLCSFVDPLTNDVGTRFTGAGKGLSKR